MLYELFFGDVYFNVNIKVYYSFYENQYFRLYYYRGLRWGAGRVRVSGRNPRFLSLSLPPPGRAGARKFGTSEWVGGYPLKFLNFAHFCCFSINFSRLFSLFSVSLSFVKVKNYHPKITTRYFVQLE
mgnify:CR=1 FL=1